MSFSTILVEPNCTASITKCGDIEIQVSDSLLFFYRICSFRFMDLIQLVQLKNELILYCSLNIKNSLLRYQIKDFPCMIASPIPSNIEVFSSPELKV